MLKKDKNNKKKLYLRTAKKLPPFLNESSFTCDLSMNIGIYTLFSVYLHYRFEIVSFADLKQIKID